MSLVALVAHKREKIEKIEPPEPPERLYFSCAYNDNFLYKNTVIIINNMHINVADSNEYNKHFVISQSPY